MRERLPDKWRRTSADFLARFVSSDESHHHVVLLAPLSGENPPRAAFVSVVFSRAALAPARRGRASPPPRDVPVRVGRRGPVPPGEEGHDGRARPQGGVARCARNRPAPTRPRRRPAARAGVRSTACPHDVRAAACPHNLTGPSPRRRTPVTSRRWAALQAVVRDPSAPKHSRAGELPARWGHCCRGCSPRPLRVRPVVSVDIAPHRVVVYAHHTERPRSSTESSRARSGAPGPPPHHEARSRGCASETKEGSPSCGRATRGRQGIRAERRRERARMRARRRRSDRERSGRRRVRARGGRARCHTAVRRPREGRVRLRRRRRDVAVRAEDARAAPSGDRARARPPRGVPIGHERRRRGFALAPSFTTHRRSRRGGAPGGGVDANAGHAESACAPWA